MKKLLMTLAIVAALTACSSTKEVQDTKDLNQDVVATGVVEEQVQTVEEVTPTEEVVVEDVATMETLYNKNGLSITSEEEAITLVMPTDVVFDFDKYNVKDEFKSVLNLLAEALMANEDLKVTIDGYTDSIGNKEYNDVLSLKRANSARDYLVKMGVAADRIETAGHGFDNPIASNDTEEGRAENRRVEVTISR